MLERGTSFSQTYRVNREIYQLFIETFKDRNPLHTEKAFAQEKGFHSVVMHGNILNGFLSHFIGECLPFKNVIIQTQEIKYLKPVYLNDKLNLSVLVQDYYESVNTVELKFYFENQQNLKVARGKIFIGII